MITPYPPPQGPRVELLRVRRVDRSAAVERSGPAPPRDPADTQPTFAQAPDRVEISNAAIALLVAETAVTTTNPDRSHP